MSFEKISSIDVLDTRTVELSVGRLFRVCLDMTVHAGNHEGNIKASWIWTENIYGHEIIRYGCMRR